LYQQRLKGAFQEATSARREEERQRRRAEQQLARFHVSDGMQAFDQGDLFGALPFFVEAMRLDQGGEAPDQRHRLRLAAVLRQCPRLVHLWPHSES
jgi:hypothetical protein